MVEIRLDDLIDSINARHPEGEPLTRLSEAVLMSRRLGEVADQVIGHFVDQARRSGATWSAIGDAMGVTKQAAQKRFVPSGLGREEDLRQIPLRRFTARAMRTVAAARREAAAMSRDKVGSVHLMLGVLSEPEGYAAKALIALGASPEQVRERAGAGPFPDPAADDGERGFDDRAKKALALGLHAAMSLGHNYIGTEHLLLGILADGNDPAAKILADLGVTEERTRAWVEATIEETLASREQSG